MPIYATADDLTAYLKRSTAMPPVDDDDANALLEEAEREVDRYAGVGWPWLSTGRRFDPPSLPVYAREALKRATCAAAEWLLMVEPGERAGDTDYLPDSLRVERRAGRVAPRLVEELAGSGLVLYSGTVTPDLDGSV
jgi:hypothetical protein